MGSIYPRRRRWWIKFRLSNGQWQAKATPFRVDSPDDRDRASIALADMERAIGASMHTRDSLAITVEQYGARWVEQRNTLRIDDWTNDESRLRCHVYRYIGAMPLAEVRARHIAELILAVRRRRPQRRRAPSATSTVCCARCFGTPRSRD